MSYIPKDARWFLADLVLEIRVAGSKRNVVHINYVIVHARSPEAAYTHAMRIGKRCDISYVNPHGKMVTTRFRGLGNLDVIHDPLGDECEIMFREKLGVTEKGIRRMMRPKRELEVFMPVRQRPGRPNYSSRDVMSEVERVMRGEGLSTSGPLFRRRPGLTRQRIARKG